MDDKVVVVCEKDEEFDFVYTNLDDVKVFHLKQEDEEKSFLEELKVKTGTYASRFVDYLLKYEGKDPFTYEDWNLSEV